MKHLKYTIFSIILIAACIITMGLFFQGIFAHQATNDTFLSLPIHAGFDNTIYTTTLQNDRKVLVGGEFTTYDGTTANKIIRLFSDGRKDTSFNIGSGFNDAVRAIVIQEDGKILVGGQFTNYNGVTANRIIRLNLDGTRDDSFVIGDGFNAQVRTLAIQEDGKILVGGAITSYNGTVIYRIARLNTNGSIDTSFNVGLGLNNNIRSIVCQEDGKIILGGGFITYSGVVTNRIIRLNPNGSRDNSFIIGSGFNNQVNSVAIGSDGKIIIGGLFTGYNGTSVNRIARLNNNGSLDSSFHIGDGFNDQTRSIITHNNKLIVGGDFTSYNSSTSNRIIRLNNDGTRDTSFDIGTGLDNSCKSLNIQTDGKILVGGDFVNYKGFSFGHLIRLHGDSYISLLDTDNKDAIHAEFVSKGYSLSQSVLSGSTPMVFIDTEGRVPVELRLKNENILLTLPQNLKIKNSSNMVDYTGTFTPPTFIANSKSDTIVTIQVGSSSTGLSLTNGLATLSVPVDDATAGDLVEIFYSEDNGDNWSIHTKTFVNDINGQPYVSFTTNHFTDFAISTPLNAMTGSFTINNDTISTTSLNVTLNISTTPAVDQMRFSNDGISWSTREPYTTSKSWTLSAGYGSKTIYAQFDIDGDGTSDVNTSDDIEYTDYTTSGCPPGWDCGSLTLKILSGASYCEYGKSLDFGHTGNSYNARSLTTDFLTTSGNTAWFCEDKQGIGSRLLSIQASDVLNITTNNPSHTISASNVLIKNPAAHVTEGICTSSSGDSLDNRIDISSATTILGKAGNAGEGCNIATDNVDMKINLTGSQAIGMYSGIITINIPNF